MIKASTILKEFDDWLMVRYKNKTPYLGAAGSILRSNTGTFDLMPVVNAAVNEIDISASTLRLRKVFFDFLTLHRPDLTLASVECDLDIPYRVEESELIKQYGETKWLTNRWLGYLLTDLKLGTFFPANEWFRRHTFSGSLPGTIKELIAFLEWVKLNHPGHEELHGNDPDELAAELDSVIHSKASAVTRERVSQISERRKRFQTEVLKFTKDPFEIFILFILGGSTITAADLLGAKVKEVLSGKINGVEYCKEAHQNYKMFVKANKLFDRDPAVGFRITRNDITRIVNRYLVSIKSPQRGINGLRKRLGFGDHAFAKSQEDKGWLAARQK